MCYNLTSLYKYTNGNNIEVYYFPMRSCASAAFPGRTVIIDTDKLEASADEIAHLTYELGHIETGSFYNINSKFMVRGQIR